MITNTKIIANHFNNHFETPVKNTVNEIGTSNSKYQDYLKNPNNLTIFHQKVLKSDETKQQLKHLKQLKEDK